MIKYQDSNSSRTFEMSAGTQTACIKCPAHFQFAPEHISEVIFP